MRTRNAQATDARQSRRSARTSGLVWLVAGVLSSQCFASAADLDRKAHFQIPAQPLDAALIEFSRQSGVALSVAAKSIDKMISPTVKGTLKAGAALTELLAASGLGWRIVGDTVTIAPTTIAAAGDQASGAASEEAANAAAIEPGGTAPTNAEPSQLEEILVTAQKREERLLDVPVPVTALSAASLVDTNQLRLQDYYSSVPGLSVTPGDFRGDPGLTIRGVTTGGEFANPTVGVVIDDVPVGATIGLAGGGSAIDLDPSDLAHVEVLRGPQGTLYGASSIGGLLKYVTVDPSTAGLSGHLQSGLSGVTHGAQLGYNIGGGVNIPLTDTLAIRMSGFARQDPGYVENLQTGQHGVNEAKVDGGHLSALWTPSDVMSLKVSALFQDIKVYGSAQSEPALGDLVQSDVRGTGAYNKNTQLYSAILKAKLGRVDLTVLSGYGLNTIVDSYDETPIYGAWSQNGIPGSGFDGFGTPGTEAIENIKTKKYTEEVRLSAPINQSLDWVFGAFYTHESTSYIAQILAVDPTTGRLAGTWMTADSVPTTYEEYAVFTDLTFHFTDRFDIQVGGRESENRQSYTETITGIIDPVLFSLPSPISNQTEHTKDNSFTYLVTPSFKVAPHVLAYARLASGYRAGGPNPLANVYGLPGRFSPDRTQNYEIGAKAEFLDRRLTLDASLFYIDWKRVQLYLLQPTTGALYYTNANRAKSEGTEVSVEARPISGLKIATWFVWNEAVLTEGFPPGYAAYGVAGDRLPYSSRWSGNVSLDDEFPLGSRLQGFVGATVSYVSQREGVFTPTPLRQGFPSYTKTDLRCGTKYNSWAVSAFVDNVADKRGYLGGGIGALINPRAFTFIQPRTYGLSVAKTF